MRTLLVCFVAAAALAVGGSVAGGASTTAYHGTFSGPVTFENCPGAPTGVAASGVWNAARHGETDATATFSIFTQAGGGKTTHHVSYGGTFQQSPRGSAEFDFQFLAGPNPVHVTLVGTTFRYVVGPPYVAFGLDCPNGVVTYGGTAG